MSEAVITTAVTTVGVIVAAWLGNRKINALGKDVKATREDAAVTRAQTENEHAEAEYPNLRDEVTAVRESVSDVDKAVVLVLDALTDVKRALRRHDSEIGGIREDLHQQRDWFGNEQVERRLLSRALAEHLPHAAERDRLIAALGRNLETLAEEVRSHHGDRHDDAPYGREGS